MGDLAALSRLAVRKLTALALALACSKFAVALLANVDGEHLDDHALKIAALFAEPE